MFVLCAYKRKDNGRRRTFFTVNETKSLKPSVKHKSTKTKASNPHVKYEQNETKALKPNVKHKLNETKALKPYVNKATCTSGLSISQGIRVF